MYNKIREYFVYACDPLFYYISIKIDLRKLLEYPVSWFRVYIRYPKMLVTIFVIMPKIFLASLFIIEVLYFHKIDYFYKFLPILLLLLLCLMVWYIL